MRADARRRRQLIIDAASRTFHTDRDENITLETIAKDAGVGIATLYRHFPSRRDLHNACALNLLDTLDRVLAQALDTFDRDPARLWENLIMRLVDEGTGMLVAALARQHSGGIDATLLSRLEQVMGRLEVLLAKAAEHGLVDPSIGARERAAELIVVTRPQNRMINEEVPAH